MISIEHYKRLLDQAQLKKENDENNLKKLKPGGINPNPELRITRSDSIDMNEDEKETLTEPRISLANTERKNAQKKVRVRMIAQVQ